MNLRKAVLAGLVLLVQIAVIVAAKPFAGGGADIAWSLLCAAAGASATLLLVAKLAQPVRGAQEPAPALPDESDAAQRALALGVSHEIRQPLFAIQLTAGNALAHLAADPPDHMAARGALSRIAAQAEKAAAIAAQMLELAQLRTHTGEPVDLRAAVEASLADWRLTVSEDTVATTITVTGCPAPGCRALVDPVGLGQVIANALENAAESIAQRRQAGWAGQGRIDIALTCGRGTVTCELRDNGAGIEGKVSQRAFEPFFSTRTGKAGGFGLFLSREIVSRAGGTIALDGAPGGGATLTITLPAA